MLKKRIVHLSAMILLLIGSWFGAHNLQFQPSPEEQLDAILNSTSDCYAPCWRGLVLGQSTREDFLMLVSRSPQNFFSNMNTGGPDQYHWSDKKTNLGVYLGITNELLVYIEFFPSVLIPIKTVFTKLGEPDKISIGLQNGIDHSLLQVRFFYFSEGIVLENEFHNPAINASCTFELTNELSIPFIYIIPASNISPFELNEKMRNIGVIRPWEGFGQVAIQPCGGY